MSVEEPEAYKKYKEKMKKLNPKMDVNKKVHAMNDRVSGMEKGLAIQKSKRRHSIKKALDKYKK